MATKKKKASLEEYGKKRDFSRTPEPRPSARKRHRQGKRLRFVVQKHAARQLHYDLRLEMEGAMRSWAVPKGPSADPNARRLAMEVEDHPLEYNQFEGTIPEDEYGGGTVMLWDHGTYRPDDLKRGEDPEKAVMEAYEKGKLSFTFFGERLRGSFTLVRTHTVEGGQRSKWLLIKHQDEHTGGKDELLEHADTSVTTGRTMDEIADGQGGTRVWHSNRAGSPRKGKMASAGPTKREAEPGYRKFPTLMPMLAKIGSSVPTGPGWIFEPKYDGLRVLGFVTHDTVALITRNGHDKARQFPEVVEALQQLAEDTDTALVLDGEIVALEKGKIVRFESLQGRTNLQDSAAIRRLTKSSPVAFVAFDLLLEGTDVLVQSPLTQRRKRLEAVLKGRVSDAVRISEAAAKSAGLLRRAKRNGWEGIIAKQASSIYEPDKRSGDWLKLKLENQQELVIGGWTEPRRTRPYLGAVLLGYYDDSGTFVYAGHTGTGFRQATLLELHRRLKPLERRTPPFTTEPRTNEKVHWVSPRLVAEIKFNEWTRDGKLRQPVFVGIREDKNPREVIREPVGKVSGKRDAGKETDERVSKKKNESSVVTNETTTRGRSPSPRTTAAGHAGAEKPVEKPRHRKRTLTRDPPTVRKLRELTDSGGELKLGKEASIPITNLDKVFFPRTGHTKGDILQYYARVGDYIVRRMRDRPLVLKRFPNGVKGEAFYQQAAPDSVPPGVRVETLRIGGKSQRRLVGGNLATLLYTVQLGAISYDPWHSRVTDLKSADYAILDLDPGPGVGFEKVVEVARVVKREMDEFGLRGAVKTSGSSGLHIYLPLKPGVPLDAALLVAQIVATRVARKYPKIATIERMTKKRPRGTVYVDYLQNILGKSIAGVYAVRAKPEPTVSTPLSWDELKDDLDLRRFTIETVPARVAEVGDLWAEGMAKGNSLDRVLAVAD